MLKVTIASTFTQSFIQQKSTSFEINRRTCLIEKIISTYIDHVNGDGGNRTRVQKLQHLSVYAYILPIKFRATLCRQAGVLCANLEIYYRRLKLHRRSYPTKSELVHDHMGDGQDKQHRQLTLRMLGFGFCQLL